ncbi:MAG: hypothetical protein Q7R52_05140 [archaeon]|nr:hypothetical protein [archaeon]
MKRDALIIISVLIGILVLALIFAFSFSNLNKTISGKATLPTQFDVNKLGRTYISPDRNWNYCIEEDNQITTKYKYKLLWMTKTLTYADECLNNNQSRDYSCDGKKPYYIDVNCENGCESGECVGEDLCEDYYNGIKYDGFCFTDFENTVFEYPKAENGTLKYRSDQSNVERVIEYPTSIKVVDFGVNFSIKIKLENKGNSKEKIRLNNFKIYIFDTENIEFDQEYILNPKENKEISIPIKLSNINARQGVNKYISFEDNENAYILPRIILYWDYNPFSEESVEIKECGERRYNENEGICNNNIFFPAVDGFSCKSDSDCNKYSDTQIGCYEYSCLYTGDNYLIGPRNKDYKVVILPVIITDSDKTYQEISSKVNDRLNNIIPSMKNWFISEKEYWNVSNNFFFDFYPESICRLTHEEYDEITKNDEDNHISEDSLRDIIKKYCISKIDYDILIISLQRDEYFDNSFEGGGVNYGYIMQSDLNPRTIFHELGHSFGEHDLYGVESYQWGNCYLYNVNTGGDWNEKMPHLCKFEAMQIGWYPKFPN